MCGEDGIFCGVLWGGGGGGGGGGGVKMVEKHPTLYKTSLDERQVGGEGGGGKKG